MEMSYNVFKGLVSLIVTLAISITQYFLIFKPGLLGEPIKLLGEFQWIVASLILASIIIEISKLFRSTIKLNKSTLIIPINQNKKVLHLRWVTLIMLIVIVLLTVLIKVLILRVFLIFFMILLAFQYYLPSYKCGVYDVYIYYRGHFFELNNLTKVYTYDNEVRMTFTMKRGPFRLTRKIELESEGDEHEAFVRVIKSRSNNF